MSRPEIGHKDHADIMPPLKWSVILNGGIEAELINTTSEDLTLRTASLPAFVTSSPSSAMEDSPGPITPSPIYSALLPVLILLFVARKQLI
jgi:hypothetical protein